MKKVICLGSATKDIFIMIDRIKILDNPKDLTAKKLMAFEYGAKIYADALMEELGGSAVNVATGLNQAGCCSFVFSRTDRSASGQWIQKQIGHRKIKKNYLQENGGQKSEVTIILVDSRTIDHVIFRTGDSINNFNIEKAIRSFQEKCDWIFIGSQKESWEKNLTQMVAFAKSKKALIALNPSSFQLEKAAKKLVEYLKHIEILFLNRDEAIELIKRMNKRVKDDPQELLKKILAFGPSVVVITDGEKGAYAANHEGQFFLDIAAKHKVDAVGAGDAFTSGFMASYMDNQKVKNALAWGIANSAGVVSAIGGTKGLLTQKQLNYQGNELLPKVKSL